LEELMASELLDEKIKDQVKEFFSELDKPVKILFFGSKEQNCEYCQETIALINEIAELNEKISVEEYDFENNPEMVKLYTIDKVPMTVIAGMNDNEILDYGIRLSGIPAGHEFTTLINDLVMVSKGDSGLSQPIKDQLSSLVSPVNLKVFVTPTCPYCPQAVILAHQMAMESKFVSGEMVEAMEFAELSTKFNISGVPHTIINDGSGEVVGAVPESRLMSEIEKALA
jgi:glutaredoxin-like protein